MAMLDKSLDNLSPQLLCTMLVASGLLYRAHYPLLLHTTVSANLLTVAYHRHASMIALTGPPLLKKT